MTIHSGERAMWAIRASYSPQIEGESNGAIGSYGE